MIKKIKPKKAKKSHKKVEPFNINGSVNDVLRASFKNKKK